MATPNSSDALGDPLPAHTDAAATTSRQSLEDTPRLRSNASPSPRSSPSPSATPAPADATTTASAKPLAASPPPAAPGTDLAPSSPLASSPAAAQTEDLVTKVLQFLSTATPGTLSAIAVGLSAVTYFILGQVGLLLIGAFAGILLFSAWESRHPELSRAPSDDGAHYLERLLDLRSSSVAACSTEDDEANEADALARSFDDFQPDTRNALSAMVDAVVRDYVDWWYAPIVPSDRSFPLACRRVLTSLLLSISNQMARKRPADAFVDFVTHSCSIVIVFISQMSAAYAYAPSTDAPAAEVIYNYLAGKEDSPLANLLNQRQQAAKFKMVAEDLLDFLDKSAHDCDPVRLFLKEILSTIVLEGTLQTCSKPEWINGWIVYLLESGETDLSQAIDEAIENQKAFSDIDGNVGNIGLSRGSRNSYETDRARRKDSTHTHKKKLSKADEEMERAMEEMKKLNEMIAEADKKRGSSESASQPHKKASTELHRALEEKAKELETKMEQHPNGTISERDNGASLDISAPSRGPSMDSSIKDGMLPSPVTSRSTTDLSSQSSSPPQKKDHPSLFTSFDQLGLPVGQEDSPSDVDPNATIKTRKQAPPLTLHDASITIHDDTGNDKMQLRNKPTWEYLIQIEPAATHHPGWMVMKSYPQFEALHESLRRLATISGSTAFLEAFATFPSWKIHHRSSLRGEIERYMRTACAERPLAESEALKRFLDKAQDARAANRGFSFESVGKGMLGAIQNAPKGALDSGKVVVGGVTGVFNTIGLGPRKSTNSSIHETSIPETSIPEQEPAPQPAPTTTSTGRPLSMPSMPRMEAGNSPLNGSRSRDSVDSQRSSIISVQPGKMPLMDRSPSYQMEMDQEALQPSRADRWDRKSISGTSSIAHSRASSMAAKRSPMRSPSETSLTGLRLPPPPTEMTDDYEAPPTRHSMDGRLLSPSSVANNGYFNSPTRSPAATPLEKPPQSISTTKRRVKHHTPLAEQETRVAVELLFAVINELYTLSSAWNIRRTLLTAAKSYLLRPGNPSLLSIQSLIQSSLLDSNLTDDGIAAHITKLRENALPTEEEKAEWPAEMTADEKEELRVKARKLFIQSSVPTALMGIMGQSATSEALGRIFDCLQIEEISRGLFFGLLLQAIRVITH